MGSVGRLLIVTAVAAERDAVCAGLGIPLGGLGTPGRAGERVASPEVCRDPDGCIDVAVVGVGPASAAAGTARLLATEAAAGRPYDAVINAGVAGGFPGRAAIGDVVVADASIAADLGAESPDGFLTIDTLGFGTQTLPARPDLVTVPGARIGPILTVTTITGTADTTRALATRHPDALAEAMEGFGVATAASQAGVPFVELRTVSNLVGVRDRAAWRLADALAALTTAVTALAPTTRSGVASPRRPTPERPV